MTILKPKIPLRKRARAVVPSDKPKLRPQTSSTGGSFSPAKRAAINARRDAMTERLWKVLGEMETVSIATARSQIPKLIRDSSLGRAYLISNAKATEAPSAVLIGLEELNRVVPDAIRTERTLGEVLAALPFSGLELVPPKAEALPGGGLPTLRRPE